LRQPQRMLDGCLMQVEIVFCNSYSTPQRAQRDQANGQFQHCPKEQQLQNRKDARPLSRASFLFCSLT
jgi:hypothetical protein